MDNDQTNGNGTNNGGRAMRLNNKNFARLRALFNSRPPAQLEYNAFAPIYAAASRDAGFGDRIFTPKLAKRLGWRKAGGLKSRSPYVRRSALRAANGTTTPIVSQPQAVADDRTVAPGPTASTLAV